MPKNQATKPWRARRADASAVSDEVAVVLPDPVVTPTASPASPSGSESAVPTPSEVQKPSGIVPVGPCSEGEGLPYAPEGFPNPGDKWKWKVGRRKNLLGYWTSRYLTPPETMLKQGFKKVWLTSKSGTEKYMQKNFPEVDVDKFMASFIWPVPCMPEDEEGEEVNGSTKRSRELDNYETIPVKRACKAGNVKCSLEIAKGKVSKAMDCDICCVESGFCRECSCILCGNPVDHELDEHSFVRCQGKLSEEFICGHVAHLECAVTCQTGGVVRNIDLDVEYYCRRCDKKTDLFKHVLGLITTPGSGQVKSYVENSLKLALRLIQDTQQTRCRSLENLIQKAVKKFQSGIEVQDIFGDLQDSSVTVNADMAHDGTENTSLLKPSNISPILHSKSTCNGGIHCEISHQENSPVCVSAEANQEIDLVSRTPMASSKSYSRPLQARTVKGSALVHDQIQQKEPVSEDFSKISDLYNLPAKFRALEFENKIYQKLDVIRHSQEREYKINREKLFAQKDLVLSAFQKLDEAKDKLTKCPSSFEKTAQKELKKFVHMLGVAEGFGNSSKESCMISLD